MTLLRARRRYYACRCWRQQRRRAEHEVTRDHLRRIGPGSGRAGDGSTQGSRPARRRGVEQAHARLSGSGAAVAPRWVTRSTLVISISKSVALAATRIRPLPSTSCGDRKQRRFMNLERYMRLQRLLRSPAPCLTSAAIWLRCAPPRSRRAIRPGRELVLEASARR